MIAIITQNFFFSVKNFGDCFKKFFLPVPIMDAEKHITWGCFENAASRAKTNVIATVHFTDDDVGSYKGPRMLILKTAKPSVNSK